MERPPIPAVRELNDFHAEVKQITAACNCQVAQIRNARKLFVAKMKECNDLRGALTLLAGYASRLAPSNAADIARLPCFHAAPFRVCDRLMEISGLGSSTRTDIQKFLKLFYANRKNFADIFASIAPADLPESPAYLPPLFRTLDFLACSTVPAVFGYFWAVELKLAFAQFAGELAARVTLPRLREHWVADAIRYYVLGSEIRNFFRMAVSGIFSKFCHEQETGFARLAAVARDALAAMQRNLAVFPADVKYLIKKVTEGAPDVANIGALFLAAVFEPALANPKAYGALPRTYRFEGQQSDSGKALAALARLFRCILHPNEAGQIPGADVGLLETLPFAEFFTQLVEVTEGDLTGLKLLDLVPHGACHFINVTFSILDVYLLVELMEENGSVSQLADSAKKLAAKQLASFEFF
jgi:hypothetical protein